MIRDDLKRHKANQKIVDTIVKNTNDSLFHFLIHAIIDTWKPRINGVSGRLIRVVISFIALIYMLLRIRHRVSNLLSERWFKKT
jgi:hypothetical protein